ncbi:MAG: DUF4147 domain-containing protein [Acidobacteriota bacterium]|nr:DUF4147 domain-containing protein [Acidobacteriota bacterium]
MKVELLMNEVLRSYPLGRALAEIMAAALDAVEPGAAVRRALRGAVSNTFVIGRNLELNAAGQVFVVGAGKACAPMTEAAAEVLSERIGAGVIVVKEGHLGTAGSRIGAIELFEAGHPLPDARGIAAAERLAALAAEATADDLLVVLISGGGSALLTLPDSGLSLADVRQLTQVLLACGATINEINALRKRCLQLAGGRLAQLAAPAQIATLIISDVVGSPLDVIASGPTAPDSTTYADAWNVVERYRIESELPPSIINHLRRGLAGEVPETPKCSAPFWEHVHNTIIADNATAAEAAIKAARARGFDAQLLTTYLEGEAREVGRVAASIARELVRNDAERKRPVLIVAGGETTVTLRGQGRGGRNQELALGAVEGLAGLDGALIATLATDGGDGPTDAAGAIVTGETLARARALNLEPGVFLRENNAYDFFARLGASLRPGPTLTNVNDLLFICVAPRTDE